MATPVGKVRERTHGAARPLDDLERNAATLENVLWDFNVKGEIIDGVLYTQPRPRSRQTE